MDFKPLPRFEKYQLKIMELIPKWEMLYQCPRSVIENQIVTSHVWCDANGDRSPKKQITRFLNSWMSIADRMGHLRGIPSQPVGVPIPRKVFVEDRPAEEDVMTADDFKKMREAI